MLTELRMRATICSDLLGRLAACGSGMLRAGCAGNVRAGRIVGAGHVEDDLGLGVFLLGDGGEGAEGVVGDVGECGGAGGGGFVFGGGGGGGGGGGVVVGGGGGGVGVGGGGGEAFRGGGGGVVG